MKRIFLSLIVGLTSVVGVHAQTTLPDLGFLTPLACSGDAPEWSLYVSGKSAQFSFQRDSDLTLMLDTPAERANGPRALTLIGRGDSAIVIFEPATCEDGDVTGSYSARVLTQRGDTPLLLTGCCAFLQG